VESSTEYSFFGTYGYLYFFTPYLLLPFIYMRISYREVPKAYLRRSFESPSSCSSATPGRSSSSCWGSRSVGVGAMMRRLSSLPYSRAACLCCVCAYPAGL
jgi:hypothetical protein